MQNPFRHQLASTSPITAGALGSAGWTLVRGDRGGLPKLEEVLRSTYAVSAAQLCGSGTEALVMAFRAAGALLDGKSPSLVLPSFNCFDVASAAVRHGGAIRFYDLDPETLGPDPASLHDAMTTEGQIVLVASLYGIPIDWDTITPVVERMDTVVVEDAAQGNGARWHGARLGGHGRLGVLSFGRGKGWTGGAGGALLIRSEEDAERLTSPLCEPGSKKDEVKTVVRAAAHWVLGRPGIYGLPRKLPGLGLGETHYHDVGEPTAMPASASTLLLRSHADVEGQGADRRRIADEYATALAEVGIGRLIQVPDGGEAGYIRYPVILPQGMDSFRDPVRAAALGAAGSYPRPLPALPVLAKQMIRSAETVQTDVASELADKLVTLPTHHLSKRWERRALVALLAL